MAVYYSLLIGAIILGIPLFKNYGLPKKKQKLLRAVYCVSFGLALFWVAAVRKGTGYDYNLYASWFNNIFYMPYEDIMSWSREKGFSVPVKILQVITLNWQYMFALIALAVAGGIMFYIYKYSALPHISAAAFLAFGLYFNSLNFMRQVIAGIILAFSLKYIYENQPLRFLALVLLASCLHFSALIFIPFYLILKIKMNWAVLGVYCAVSAILFFFSVDIMLLVTKYFYSSYNPLSSAHVTTGINPFFTVFYAVFFIIVFLLRKPLIMRDGFNSLLINSLFFTLFFTFMGIKHSILSRFMIVFVFAPVLLLVPELFIVIKNEIGKKFSVRQKFVKPLYIGAVCLIAALGLGVFNLFMYDDNNGILPYNTIYFSEPAAEGDNA